MLQGTFSQKIGCSWQEMQILFLQEMPKNKNHGALKKIISSCRCWSSWTGLPREVVESPSLEDSTSCKSCGCGTKGHGLMLGLSMSVCGWT